MKDIIEKYKKVNPRAGYFELSKVFGISLDDLFYTLDIKKYQIDTYCIEFFNRRGQKTYYESIEGHWNKTYYDSLGDRIKNIDCHGYWEKWEYDDFRRIIKTTNKSGETYVFKYKENGKTSYLTTKNGYWERRDYDKNGVLLNATNGNR